MGVKSFKMKGVTEANFWIALATQAVSLFKVTDMRGEIMKKSILYATIFAIILMFVSLVSWILKEDTLAILTANFGLVILAVMTLWENRKDLTH